MVAELAPRRHAMSCAEIPVLLVGRTSRTAAVHELLTRSAHPVRQVPTWRAAEQAVTGMRVAVLFSLPSGSLIACLDRLVRAPGLRVILALPEIDISVEEQTMLREYVHVYVLGLDFESMHALVHDVLHATPNPEPTGLHDRGFLH
jgi:hypothetical protein